MEMHQRPIFILGCQRSGTTLLRLIMDSHPNISCGPESKFLVDLSKIVGDYWNRVGLFGFDRDYWHKKIADFFGSFQMEYAEKRGKKRWADKAPGFTDLGFLCALFPDCQMIHIIRDGRDVVLSHRDKWGYRSALRAIRFWPRYVTLVRSFGGTLPSDQYFEVRYEKLVKQPESVLRGLFEYLGEPWDPAVLRHEEAQHDIVDWYSDFAEGRRRVGGERSAIYSSRVGVAQREFGPLITTFFRFHASGVMKELGYS